MSLFQFCSCLDFSCGPAQVIFSEIVDTLSSNGGLDSVVKSYTDVRTSGLHGFPSATVC